VHAELAAGAAGESSASPCDLTAASPWISRWFTAWELASREILHLPDAPPPGFVFFDSTCVYTTLEVAAAGTKMQNGPKLRGASLPWRTALHGDTLTLPNERRMEVTLLSFAGNDKKKGPFFVMAAPSYWAQKGAIGEPGLTGVFLHEFTHTRQLAGMAKIIEPIDAAWKRLPELTDDIVQHRFGKDSVYIAAYLEERDLFYRAASAGPPDSVRALAVEALAMMRRRQARWFVGDDAVFSTLDDTWLSMEGAGQWVAVAWLSHPRGGGMTRDAAIAKMLGGRRWWSQDESLAIFLVIERLLPDWPKLVFRDPSAGVLELLARATRT
jgi:hypothetical protein